MIKVASEFYELDISTIKQYTSTIAHTPDESAVKHMVTQITKGGDVIGGPPVYVYYQCSYCEDRNYNSLADVESHIWSEGEDHRDINLRRIEDEARNDTAKANIELQQDIDNAINGKKDAELKQQLSKQHTEESRLKKTLPYAKI